MNKIIKNFKKIKIKSNILKKLKKKANLPGRLFKVSKNDEDSVELLCIFLKN
jgi:hypothetical protein